nr:DUF1223 domain-containing protein [uncultured Celeribacter sp.]
MRHFFAGLALAVMTGFGPGALLAQDDMTPSGLSADSGPIVVELFTSQGCSSCPPADEMITELSQRSDVLPLSLHVDYWDYIGWRDDFAQPQFTQRQKAYAHAVGKRTIYTPQMVVQGREHVLGTKPMQLADLILRHQARDAHPIALSASREGDTLSLQAVPLGQLPAPIRVQVVRFSPHARVEIKRGENAGRVLEYSNIVTQWQPIADWDGRTPLKMSVTLSGPDRTAVLLQASGPGPILAAARAD